MNQNDVLVLYRTLAELTAAMLDAARRNDWDAMTSLERECAGRAGVLRNNEHAVALDGVQREEKVALIKQILADDRQIRDITEGWMKQVTAAMSSQRNGVKLARAYGANETA